MTEAATDARTAPVAVWQVLEKMTKEEREAWRVAPIANRPSRWCTAIRPTACALR